MEKQILYILFLLPAIFLFENSLCQNPKNNQIVLVAERTTNMNGSVNIKSRKFAVHNSVRVVTGDNTKIRGRITQITDSTISVGKTHGIRVKDIFKISSYNGPLLAISGGLFLLGTIGAITAVATGASIGSYAIILYFPAQILFYVGAIDQLSKIYYSLDRGWKFYTTTNYQNSKPVYIIK